MIEALKAFIAALIVSVAPAGGDPAEAWGNTHEARVMSVLVPLVAKWEGLSLNAYQDIVGVWTICYGHIDGVRPGDRMTQQQCEDLLREELSHYHHALMPAFTADTLSKRLPPERHAAFDSLSYNVGTAGTARSTAVRRLNSGDIRGACAAIGWWNKAGGRVVRGLVNRRADETALCLKGA